MAKFSFGILKFFFCTRRFSEFVRDASFKNVLLKPIKIYSFYWFLFYSKQSDKIWRLTSALTTV